MLLEAGFCWMPVWAGRVAFKHMCARTESRGTKGMRGSIQSDDIDEVALNPAPVPSQLAAVKLRYFNGFTQSVIIQFAQGAIDQRNGL